MMDGTASEEFNGYKCYGSDDANIEVSLKFIFSNSMIEGRCSWLGVKCDLFNDVGVFVASGHVNCL
jgi:hypothetical protein